MDQKLAGKLGIDLGSVNVKAAWLPRSGDSLQGTPAFCAPARGRPLKALEELLDGSLHGVIGEELLQLSLTGVSQGLLAEEIPASTPNEVVATALAVAKDHPGTRTVIDVGGQFTKWILLDGNQVADSAINGLCAAGSGAFLEQQAARLRLSAEEMGRIAYSAKKGAPVAGRCSVFAKSDMIHLQQKGTPVEEIAYGVCLALVRTFVATVLGGRNVEPPVVLVGGGGANPGLVRAFAEVLELDESDITVPADHTTIGARGAALAASECPSLTIDELQKALRARLSRRASTLGSANVRLPPLAQWADDRERPLEDPPREHLGPGPFEVLLGVDVGSVSTNIVVLTPQGKVLQGIYLPTRGRPMEVLDEALREIEQKFGVELDILAVGATGSGRHLAAKSLGADTVKNEITAQMASAAHYFPEVDTVFEIGGQDSKYIGARNGRLASFEMNKICAAGTGSFLEEQAERLGVQIKGDFSQLAIAAETPRDLGSRCTVFMDTELVRAQQMGVSHEDICAGLAYSIARNYLEKVASNRVIGERIVFQGGTASNDAVVAAMRALTGKEVVVHPYNRISGAIGAALLAGRDHKRSVQNRSAFRGYDACRGAETKSFECKRCSNRCQVIKVRVGGEISHFGDTCERYSERDGTRNQKVDTAAKRDFFSEREALLHAALPPRRRGRPKLILPRASHLLEVAPLWAHTLDALGFDVTLSSSSTVDFVDLGASGLPSELCLPIKLASGQVRRSLLDNGEARVFVPSVLELPDVANDGQTHSCLYSQELPNLLRHEYPERVVAPQCALTKTKGGFQEGLSELKRLLGVSKRRARKALEVGYRAQERFDRERRALGVQALRAAGDKAVVVLGRPYNLHEPVLNLDLARRLNKLGLTAIPMDLLPLDDIELGSQYNHLMWRYSRDQLRALELIREEPNIFPLWVSCFGCGLDAFAFKHSEELLGDRPALTLEFDEHRGEAGLVTRLEAFVDEIDEHLADTSERVPVTPPTRAKHRLAGRIVIPNISEHAHAASASLRSEGYETLILPAPDEATIKLGEEASSGAECHPWVVIAGQMLKWAHSKDARRGDVFYYPQATNPCLIGQYGDAYRRLLARAGLEDRYQILAIDGAGLIETFGGHVAMRMYESMEAMDLLLAAACTRRPYEVNPGSVNEVHKESVRRISDAIAAGKDALEAIEESFRRLMAVPIRDEQPRPVVGVCGDFYTRINAHGNADLFARLEALGCQVWPHPYMGGLIDSGTHLLFNRWVERGQFGEAFLQWLTSVGTLTRSKPLRDAVPEGLRKYCIAPTPAEMRQLSAPYIGPRTNNLVNENVARVVDFVQGGADGVISAVGIYCMVGVAVDGAMRRIREDYPDVPMVTLAYSCAEGPAQRIKLETFVHQVHTRARKRSR